jgi:hypothetical protein
MNWRSAYPKENQHLRGTSTAEPGRIAAETKRQMSELVPPIPFVYDIRRQGRFPRTLQIFIVRGARGLVKRGPIARFIEPMDCLPVEKVPEGDAWTYELKRGVRGWHITTWANSSAEAQMRGAGSQVA